MMRSELRLTLFSIEKISTAVNVRGCSAYQICTNPGEQLGLIGTIAIPADSVPANDDSFTLESEGEAVDYITTSWLGKLLAGLKT